MVQQNDSRRLIGRELKVRLVNDLFRDHRVEGGEWSKRERWEEAEDEEGMVSDIPSWYQFNTYDLSVCCELRFSLVEVHKYLMKVMDCVSLYWLFETLSITIGLSNPNLSFTWRKQTNKTHHQNKCDWSHSKLCSKVMQAFISFAISFSEMHLLFNWNNEIEVETDKVSLTNKYWCICKCSIDELWLAARRTISVCYTCPLSIASCTYTHIMECILFWFWVFSLVSVSKMLCSAF